MAHAVVVVGAGAAGLAAALALRERGVEPLLLEAADRAGGKLGTESHRGFLMERAAVGLLDRTGELDELCGKLGLALQPASPAASLRFVERNGTVHALPRGPGEALRTRLLSAREKVGLLAEPMRRRGPGESTVAQFFAHRLGRAGAFLGDAIQTGIHAGDPDELEMRSAFPALAAMEARHGSLLRGALAAKRRRPVARLASFRHGMQELVDALAHRTAPRLQAKLLAVRAGDAGYRLQVEGEGILAEVEADRVVLAIPAPRAADALEPLDPQLATRLRELTAAPVSLVHLAVDADEVAPLDQGFGLLRPGRPVLGALFPAALWPDRAPVGRVLLSALVGGARHPEAGALPDDQLVQLIQAELRLPRAPELLRVVRWLHAIPQYRPGHAARVAEIERLTSTRPGLALTGAWYRGVGVLDCLRDGRKSAESLIK
jgi:protoporphyrinogen/coproporphyrinogen III oxidase